MKIRADTSSTLFGTLKKEIMASNHKAFSELVNSNFEYKYLSIVGESGLEVKVKNYTYIDSLSMFLTTLNDVINSEHFMKVPIYFIDIKGSSIEGINLKHINDEYNIDLMAIKKNKIDEFKKANIVEINGDFLRLTDLGFHVLNRVVLELVC